MKKIILFFGIATLISCTCLPQIPPQYLWANTSCEAYLPNYMVYITVINNCGDATLAQNPVPGTILDITNPAVEVILTATNSFGNTDIERFDVFLWDAPEIIWDSIPGDTILVAERRNDIDLLIESVAEYRDYLGYDTIVDTLTWKTLTIHYPPQ